MASADRSWSTAAMGALLQVERDVKQLVRQIQAQ